MAKEKEFVVAGVVNYADGKGSPGTVLETFRKIEFIEHEGKPESLRQRATNQGIGMIGIFHKGEFVRPL